MNTVKKDGEVIIDFLACLHLRSNKTDEMYKCFSYTKQLTAYRVDRFILIHTNSHDYISHRGTTLREALNKMMEGFDRTFLLTFV